MYLSRHLKSVVLALCLLKRAQAQNITASTCVAPNAYTQCVNQLQSFYTTCSINAGSNLDKQVACACTYQLGELNCAMTNCWNVVYGCEYQSLANLYAGACASPVPFFPAPDNAPGGCSCNLGYVIYNATQAAFDFKDCISSDVSQNSACDCCYEAKGYAALYNLCPNTSPSEVAYAGADAILDVLDPSLKQGQCASYFASYNCNSLGFTGLGIPLMTSYNTATLGTQSLSNTNTKTLTAPASGATFTWTDLGIPYTIVAASANAKAGSGASSSSRTVASATSNAGGSSPASSAAQSTPSTKSGASQYTIPSKFIVVLAVVAKVAYAFA